MNRKQKRDWLRASKGLGNEVSLATQASRTQRLTVFGGVYGKGLQSYFDKKAFAQ